MADCMSDAKMPEDAEGEPSSSGPTAEPDGDEMADRSPDTIQREIEQTRAELADTIDAIADRISPKRAASRGAQAVKAQVASVLGNGTEQAPEPPNAPAAVLDAAPSTATTVDPAARQRAVREAVSSGGASYTGTSEYRVGRRLRTDRLLLVTGAVAAAVGLVVLRRAKR